LIPVHLRG